MRRTVILLSLAVFALSIHVPRVSASGIADVSYVINSSYNNDPNTPSTLSVAPGASFSLQFTVPVLPLVITNVQTDSFQTNVPVVYSSGAFTQTDNAAVQIFFSATSGGLVSVNFTDSSGNHYAWSFFGPQLFTGSTSNPVLSIGSFAINGNATDASNSSNLLLSTSVGSQLAGLGGGTVTATPIPTPEPGSLLLLGSGLLGLAAWGKKRFLGYSK